MPDRRGPNQLRHVAVQGLELAQAAGLHSRLRVANAVHTTMLFTVASLVAETGLLAASSPV